MKSSVLAGIFAASAAAQGGPWAQCGGLSYSGPTTCVAGWKCVYLNDYFSQCLQDDGSTTQTTVTSVTSTTTSVTSTTTSDIETETSACDVETTTTTTTTSTTSDVETETSACDVETTTTSETSATSTTSDVETETSACDAETTTTTLVTVTTSSAPATSTSAAPTKGTFQWFGINESGAEFGQGSYPGTWGQSFIWPSTASLQTHIKDGYNAFRIAFSMERLAPNTLTATLDPGYLKNLTATAEFITEAGGWAILDAHNFGRYYSTVITDTAAFGTFWANVAEAFAGNPRVIFDTNNEFHDMDQTLVFDLNQAAIDGIRGAGANDQYIWVEGNSWSTAFVWNITNDNLAALEDPQDKIIYEVHQYLDADSSGSHDTCASAEIGVQRAVGMTEWLRTNKKLGVLGAFAAGPNDACKTTVTNLLDHLKENNDVWTGALWQAGGPWWSSWAFSFEPPRGTAYINYNALLKEYL